VPAPYVTQAQADAIPDVVGQVGGQPIIKVNGGNGFFAEVLPRLEGVAIVGGVALLTFGVIAPDAFGSVLRVVFGYGAKVLVWVVPRLNQAIEQLFLALGDAVDQELGISDTSSDFHWWCMFGAANAFIPACKAVPWYCVGPLGWVTEKCRGAPGQRGGLSEAVDDMESFLVAKEQEYQDELDSWINSEVGKVLDDIESNSFVKKVEKEFKKIGLKLSSVGSFKTTSPWSRIISGL
jgi:hypothetical protein